MGRNNRASKAGRDRRGGSGKDSSSNFTGGIPGVRQHRFDQDGPREMHKAKCADCGNECEVPFKPRVGNPIYCRDCFRKRKPARY
ncbi:CxxC-x17-CxxC domain-containing protein [Nanoarchaeota archaeon]